MFDKAIDIGMVSSFLESNINTFEDFEKFRYDLEHVSNCVTLTEIVQKNRVPLFCKERLKVVNFIANYGDFLKSCHKKCGGSLYPLFSVIRCNDDFFKALFVADKQVVEEHMKELIFVGINDFFWSIPNIFGEEYVIKGDEKNANQISFCFTDGNKRYEPLPKECQKGHYMFMVEDAKISIHILSNKYCKSKVTCIFDSFDFDFKKTGYRSLYTFDAYTNIVADELVKLIPKEYVAKLTTYTDYTESLGNSLSQLYEAILIAEQLPEEPKYLNELREEMNKLRDFRKELDNRYQEIRNPKNS